MRNIDVEIMAAELHIKGRRLIVECTCERCKKTGSISYAYARENGRSLSNCMTPEGWVEAGDYPGLLCRDCFESLRKWMKEGVNNAAD